MRAARVARLFSLARPIKFLICGVVFALPVIDAKAPYYSELQQRRRQQQGKRHLKRNICAVATILRVYHFDHILQCWRSTQKLDGMRAAELNI